MRKHKRLLILILLITAPQLSYSQFKWDFGGNIGASNYLGEIGGKGDVGKRFVRDLKVSQTRTALGGFARYRISPKISVKAQLMYARIKGADSLSTNPGRVGRNLSFRNDIYEFSAIGEYYFYNVNDVGRVARKRVDFRAYGYAGVGAFYHNPKASYNDEWIDLRPLRTEGQAAEYKKINLAVPMGLGFQYIIGRQFKVGLEFGWRLTFTDYLDDISTTYATDEQLGNDPLRIALANRTGEIKDRTKASDAANYEPPNPNNKGLRGDPADNDNYLISTINLSYSVRGKNSFYKSKYNYITGFKRKLRKGKVRAKF